MKSTLPLLSIALIFASCTAAYKSSQTPDDVYYSPARPVKETVRHERNDDENRYSDDEAYRDDRYLRMKVHNQRWSDLYDDYYSYNPYYYHYYNGSLAYNSPWTSYSYWNYYYNPYCSHVVIINPKSPVVSRPRAFDLSVYNPHTNNNTRTSYHGRSDYGTSGSTRTTSNAPRVLRDVFSGSSNSGSSGGSRSTGSSGSSSSGSSSSGSRSTSTNAPARRF